jgi:N-acetylmuramic acid 6-phosphate etherase
VLAISASGRTPYTLGSLEAAHAVGARTIGLTCNPDSPLAEAAELAVVPVVGPEVIAGSTRMKGGLAQKMVLHMLSTATMVRLGHVSGNLMSNLTPASEKLWERAVRIIMALSGIDWGSANALLEACDGDVGQAVRRAQRGAERERTRRA